MARRSRKKPEPPPNPGVVLRVAQTVPEFISVIEVLTAASPAGLWFRGQSNARHRLVPNALRDATPHTDQFGRRLKPGQVLRASGSTVTGISPERMLAAFKRRARPFVEILPANDFEWMFLAQHHGLPTRLLDWSTNGRAALYFAASGAPWVAGEGADACQAFLNGDEFHEEGFAVFVIDPHAVNAVSALTPHPLDIAADPEPWEAYLNPMSASVTTYSPLCVLAPHIASRIRAQSGVFTLHGSNVWPLDYYTALRPLITKIFMPFTSAKEIMRTLHTLGVSLGSIYPGLDSVARDVQHDERLTHAAELAAWGANPNGEN